MTSLARRLTLPIAALITVASAAGLVFRRPYASETASWAAQGQGQDAVHLAVVVPLLICSLALINRGSFGAWLVWLGAMIYSTYSYLLYAMFVHFSPLFPVYVATLGLSFYALFGSVLGVHREWFGQRVAQVGRQRAVSIALFTIATLFVLLWGAEIANAILTGHPPASAAALGFPVNPVHVLDLAFVLPGMFIHGRGDWSATPLGYLFAVPMLTFSALMGLAVAGMMAAMKMRGIASSPAVGGAMAISAAISGYLAARLLRAVARPQQASFAVHTHASAGQER